MIEPEHTTKYKEDAQSDRLHAILDAELARLHGWWDRLVMAYVKWHVFWLPKPSGAGTLPAASRLFGTLGASADTSPGAAD